MGLHRSSIRRDTRLGILAIKKVGFLTENQQETL